ncbi:unnamed protein product [Arctogadus glacialis]
MTSGNFKTESSRLDRVCMFGGSGMQTEFFHSEIHQESPKDPIVTIVPRFHYRVRYGLVSQRCGTDCVSTAKSGRDPD